MVLLLIIFVFDPIRWLYKFSSQIKKEKIHPPLLPQPVIPREVIMKELDEEKINEVKVWW